MKKLALIPILLLAACKTVYVPQYIMPEIPAELMVPPSKHQTIEAPNEDA